MRVEINLVMSEEGPMQQALKSEAAHASCANPNEGHTISCEKSLRHNNSQPLPP